MAFVSTNFPPIVDTYMPAFVRDGELGGCRIYFSFSPYQEITQTLPYAQIIVNNQRTNKNELDLIQYPMEIKRMQVKIDDTRNTDDKYFITVNASDLASGFEQNLFYKVQIRIDTINDNTVAPNDTFLNNSENLDNFSEWSTVCLIKSISTPVLTVEGFDAGSETLLPVTILQVTGNLVFSKGEDETLKQYQLQIIDRTNGEVVIADSGILYANSYNQPNQFTYTFKKELQSNIQYTLKVVYITRNLYSNGELYNFTISEDTGIAASVKIEVKPDIDNGRNKVYLSSIENSNQIFTGRFVISRSDYTSNFTVWEDIHEVVLENRDWPSEAAVITFDTGAQDYPTINQKLNNDETLQEKEEFLEPSLNTNSSSVMGEADPVATLEYKFLWCDKTPESGVYYKYRVYSINENNEKTVASYSDPVINTFDDMYLIGEDKMLKIKFNGNVSSYKYITMDSKTDTIGGQFPFIKRNGNVNYRQFPISGLITVLTDDYEIFSNRTVLLKGNSNRLRYQNYNDNNNITNYNNFIYERLFREEVIKFLQDGKPKLFKSLTEGNILIRLMDVNLNPESGLNRYLYNFTATAYEQAEPTVDNLVKFNIQPIGGKTLTAYLITQAEEKIITNNEQAIMANIKEE